MTWANPTEGPVWVPDLHAELSLYVERLRVPQEECCGIADEAIAVTLAKLSYDPSLHGPEPSEEIRKLSFTIAHNLAMDQHRRARREGPAVSIRPETSEDDRDMGLDVPATSAPVGHELEVTNEYLLLLLRLGAAAERMCAGMQDPHREQYARGVIYAHVELSTMGDSTPSGRSLGRLMTVRGVLQGDGTPFPETTACDILLDFFENFFDPLGGQAL